MSYSSYLIHFNRNHGKKDGKFTYGDGDGDGITNDHGNPKDNKNTGDNKGTKSVITTSTLRKVGNQVATSTKTLSRKSQPDNDYQKWDSRAKNDASKVRLSNHGTQQYTKSASNILSKANSVSAKTESKFTRVGSGEFKKAGDIAKKFSGGNQAKTESKFTRVGSGKYTTVGDVVNQSPGETKQDTNVYVGISQLMNNAEKLEEAKNRLTNVRNAVSEAVNSQVNQHKVESGKSYVSKLLTTIIGGSKKETKTVTRQQESKPEAKTNSGKEYKKSEK